MANRRTTDDPAIRITTASSSKAADIAARQKRYLLSMSLRSLCFIGAVTDAIVGGPQWVWIVLICGALILPYIAVVMANATMTRADDFELREAEEYRPQLTARPEPPRR